MSDLELLQGYTRENSQAAFATLVERYVNLVYSAAKRQVRSSHLAEEVTQSVFFDLARNAARLRPDQPLAAWLFLVTRRTAVDAIRREARRQAREQTAAEFVYGELAESAAMKTPSPTWSQVKDVVDEAMASLNETERTAILLRFFENRSLREVGESLGISEDTAQKRVSRALDRLRAVLLRRGVAVSAAGLATDLSAHAVESAPAALGATITSIAALTPLAVTTAHTAAALVAQKAVAAVVAVAVAGAVVYEASAFVRQREEFALLPAQTSQLEATIGRLRPGVDAAAQRLRAKREDLKRLAQLAPAADSEYEAAAIAWLERVARMKQLVATRPELEIPELALATEESWFTAARDARLDSEPGIAAAFKALHQPARESTARAMKRALDAHVTRLGELPRTAAQLAPFLDPKISAALLDRFEVLQRGAPAAISADDLVLAERLEFAERHGTRMYVTTKLDGTESLDVTSWREFRRIVNVYRETHNGRFPTGPEELVSYLKYSPRPAAVKNLLDMPNSDFTPERLPKLLAK